MNKPQSITSLAESPDEERNRRMVQYAVAMGIRVVCVFLCFFLQGWWLILPAIGAIVLPYFAVVIANASRRAPAEPVASVHFALPQPDRGDIQR